MRTYQFEELRPPGDRPWRDEPDKAQWVDETTGLDCLIVRGHFGALCGYVGLPTGHPWHGLSHRNRAFRNVSVHGGINFASYCQDGPEDGPGVCHVPEPGRPEHPWWIGFDCGHARDVQPKIAATLVAVGMAESAQMLGKFQTYRTFDYVREQVARLAAQAGRRRSRRRAATQAPTVEGSWPDLG